MKMLAVSVVLAVFTVPVFAGGGGAGGVPSVPCVIDGKLIHKHMLITECNKLKQQAKKASEQSK
ncbi:hypothetical protein C9I98_05030 [Photobacterium sanctipauli]|uniref:Periplasmic protein n=1 Tax=Photobacterium sanctipauli TaxID=1342794 RepID=A0A2T3NYF6_9GAMM|nr:hypothetical protein [Photobacterium sanctipauli]PSW21306.1 hypothetical protein C9I98_05030 [Photobacterium sanctipauli]